MKTIKLATLALLVLAPVTALPASAQVLIDTPSGYPESPGTSVSCDAGIGTMKRVYPAQIAGVSEGTKVWVTELCSSFEGLRSDGNASYLRPSIAQNKVLVGALGSKAYGPDDVFAVQMMGDDTINLYVHHFGR